MTTSETRYFASIHAKKSQFVIEGKIYKRTPELDRPFKKGTAFTFSGEFHVEQPRVIEVVERPETFSERFFRLRYEERKANQELLNRVVARLQKLGYELFHTSESGSRYLQLGDKIVRVSDHYVNSKDGVGMVQRWTKQIVSEIY